MTETDAMASALEEVRRATTTERNEAYGDPSKNHQRTADLWNSYLYGRFDDAPPYFEITPEDVCWMMVLLKISRSMHGENHDDVIDAMGYAANVAACRHAKKEK